jgi:hypothetical protein
MQSSIIAQCIQLSSSGHAISFLAAEQLYLHNRLGLYLIQSMFNRLLPNSHKQGIVLLFFGSLLFIGLVLVRDYGISFDEGVQRVSGQISLFYVFQKLPTSLQQHLLSPQAAALIASKGGSRQLHDYKDRDYGVVFELPASAAEQVLRLRDERQIYLFRHTCNFLVCFAGLIAFYTIATRRFASWRIGLLATLLLVLSPRIFADYFYNDKDAVFMALFTIAVATAIPFVQRLTWKTAVWHALACALAIDVRIMGVLVPVATVAFIVIRTLRNEYHRPAALRLTGLYIGLLCVLIVVMWPYLWESPVSNFLMAFSNMSHFRWPGSVLYQGHLLPATHLPWHYAPVWIFLTTPLLYLAFFGIGTLLILSTLVSHSWKLYVSDGEWQDLLFLGLGITPILAVIALHSVLYNGWRQLYFCYPLLLLVVLRGIVAVWHWQPTWPHLKKFWQPAVSLVIIISLTVIGGRMARLHPLENLYFNAFAPAPPEHYYDADYWGLSFRQGLEWMVRHDTRPHIRVYSDMIQPLTLNRMMLLPDDRNRLELVTSPAQADYVLSSYSYQYPTHYATPSYKVEAENLRILDVYRLR